MPGDWRVEIYFDNQYFTTLYFKIVGSENEMQATDCNPDLDPDCWMKNLNRASGSESGSDAPPTTNEGYSSELKPWDDLAGGLSR